MVAGSFASTYHGEPRMTHDIDLVIDPSAPALLDFVERLDRDRFYVGDALGAFERRDQFNVIDTTSGWKVDLIIRRDRSFSRTEFERRIPASFGDLRTYVASAEDTVLAKLEWGKLGGSSRQLRDAVGVLAIVGEAIDMAYLRQWAGVLGVGDEVERAIRLAAE